MSPAHTFPRSHRLGGRGTFVAIREAGRRVASGPLVAWHIPNQRTYARLGISIGKMVGNAAARNRIKRQLREAFRASSPAAIDLVVQVRPHEPVDAETYRRWWGQLLERIANAS